MRSSTIGRERLRSRSAAVPKPGSAQKRPLYEPLVPKTPDIAWGLPDDLLAKSRPRQALRDLLPQFVCDEVVTRRRVRRYGRGRQGARPALAYVLLRNPEGATLREMAPGADGRGQDQGGGSRGRGAVPAGLRLGFLFSEFNEPYFASACSTRLGRVRPGARDQVQGQPAVRRRQGHPAVGGPGPGRRLLAHPARDRGRAHRQRERSKPCTGHNELVQHHGSAHRAQAVRYRAEIEFRLRGEVKPRPRPPARPTKPGHSDLPTELRYDTRRVVSPTQICPCGLDAHLREVPLQRR